MAPLHLAAFTAEMASAILAVLLARRRPEHRPASVTLVVLIVAGAARVLLYEALPPPGDGPIMGAARRLVYLDGALQLATGAAIVGLAVAVSTETPRRAVAAVVAAWALASIALAVAYPSPLVRGAGLARVYLAANLTGLLVSLAVLARWVLLHRTPSTAHAVAIVLVFMDLAVLLVPYGPWRNGLFGPYESVQVMVLVVFAAIAAVQGVLWRFSMH